MHESLRELGRTDTLAVPERRARVVLPQAVVLAGRWRRVGGAADPPVNENARGDRNGDPGDDPLGGGHVLRSGGLGGGGEAADVVAAVSLTDGMLT